MPAKLSIDVFKISGDATTVNVDRQTTVLQLKHKLAELWKIPPELQKLFHGSDSDQLDNARYLTSLHRNKGAKLAVACVVTGEEIFACLDNSNSPLAERQCSLRALTDMVRLRSTCLDWERVVTVLRSNFYDSDFRVRELAMSGLIEIARTDNEEAAAAVVEIAIQGLEDPDDMIRTGSVELLGCINPQFDSTVLNELCNRLATDRSFSVRAELLKAISQIAPAADGPLLEAVLKLSGDEDWIVREAAAGTLAKMKLVGECDEALTALVRLSEDEERNVRIVAKQALSVCMPAKAQAVMGGAHLHSPDTAIAVSVC